MSEVAGINLKNLEEPIRGALTAYEEESGGQLLFDLDAASILTLTPDKPNSARSRSVVQFRRKTIGDLYVIAFKPGDGTGDEKSYSLDQLVTPVDLPQEAKVVPRDKTGVATEGLL